MPRYHFSLSGEKTLLDHDGEHLDDDAVARRATVQIMAETIPDQINRLLAGHSYVVEATDAAGRLVYRLTLNSDTG